MDGIGLRPGSPSAAFFVFIFLNRLFHFFRQLAQQSVMLRPSRKVAGKDRKQGGRGCGLLGQFLLFFFLRFVEVTTCRLQTRFTAVTAEAGTNCSMPETDMMTRTAF